VTSLAEVAPTTTAQAVKPTLWRRMTATPLTTMLLIVFPMAVFALTMAVIALINQLNGDPEQATKPTTVAVGSTTPKRSIPPSVSVPADPTSLAPPATPSPQFTVVPPVIDSPLPTFDPSTLEVPTPSLTPPPTLTPPATLTPPPTPTFTYSYTPTTPAPIVTRTVYVTPTVRATTAPTTTPRPRATTQQPANNEPTNAPGVIADPESVAITTTDTGSGDNADKLVPILTGTAAPKTSISIRLGQGNEVVVQADDQGKWSAGPLQDVAIGVTPIELVGTSPDGTESWTWVTVNLAGPTVLVSPQSDGGYTLTVTERPGTTFEVLLNGNAFMAPQVIGTTGTWSGFLPSMQPGNHEVAIRILAGERPGPKVPTTVRVQ
jgi:hypothetical protein